MVTDLSGTLLKLVKGKCSLYDTYPMEDNEKKIHKNDAEGI